MNRPYATLLIYAPEDYEMVREIAAYLSHYAKLHLWFEQWSAVVNEPWEGNWKDGFAQSASCAIFVGKKGILPWQTSEITELLQHYLQDTTFRIVPVLLPEAAKPSEIPVFLEPIPWIMFQQELDMETLRQIECAIRGIPFEPEEVSTIDQKDFIVQTPSQDLYERIAAFLTEIPNITENSMRRTLIEAAGFDTQLKSQIQHEYPPARFIPMLISTLKDYGYLDDKRNALQALLEATKQYVGKEKQAYCDMLIHEIPTYLSLKEQQQTLIQRIEAKLRKQTHNRIIIWGIVMLLTGLSLGAGSFDFVVKSQLSALENTNKEMTERFAERFAEAQDIQTKDENIARLTKRIEELEREIEKITNDKTALIAEVAKLEEELERKIEKITNDKTALIAEVAKLEKDNAFLRRNKEQAIENLEEELDILKNENASLRGKKEEKEEIERELSTLERTRESLENSYKSAKESARTYREDCNSCLQSHTEADEQRSWCNFKCEWAGEYEEKAEDADRKVKNVEREIALKNNELYRVY